MRKQARKPSLFHRFELWMSHSRVIDGLWVGSFEWQPGLRRVEDALTLIKRLDGLHYSRVISNLSRIWVNLIPIGAAHYDRSLNACVIDERFLRDDATTIEQIATTIIHEATHARLENWGVVYEEAKRKRIEMICTRRELDFARELPDGEPLRESIAARLEWYAADDDSYSDANFRQRNEDGKIEALRYLNAPAWLIRWAMWLTRRRRQRESVSQGS